MLKQIEFELQVMLDRAKEIEVAEIEKSKKNPNISAKDHAAGMVRGLEFALRTVKESLSKEVC